MTSVIPTTIRSMRFGNNVPSDSVQCHTDQSLRWFRLRLNARSWPKPITSSDYFGSVHAARQARRAGIKDAKAHVARMQAKHDRRVALDRKLSAKPTGDRKRTLDTLARRRAEQDDYLDRLDVELTLMFEEYDWSHDRETRTAGWYTESGWPTIEPGSAKPKPSDRRPMSEYVIWQTWLKGTENVLCLLAHPKTGTVTTTLADGSTVERPGKVTDYWVTMAEPFYFPIKQFVPLVRNGRTVMTTDRKGKPRPQMIYSKPKTEQAKALLNLLYLDLGVPMNYEPKSWRVLEPVEGCMGPFSSEDTARAAMLSWQSELDDDFTDNHDRGSGLVYVD